MACSYPASGCLHGKVYYYGQLRTALILLDILALYLKQVYDINKLGLPTNPANTT